MRNLSRWTIAVALAALMTGCSAGAGWPDAVALSSGASGFEDMATDDDAGDDPGVSISEEGATPTPPEGTDDGNGGANGENDANGGNANGGNDANGGNANGGNEADGTDGALDDASQALPDADAPTDAARPSASDRLPPELTPRAIPRSPIDYPLDAQSNRYADADKKKGGGRTILGALIIPAIDFRETIVSGADAASIKRNVGRLKGSKDPGEQGQSVVTGHRYYDWGNMFNRLDEMVVGDVVDVAAPDGTYYRYRVREVILSKPKPYELFGSTDRYELTLVTCHPIHVSTHQLLVRCELETVVEADGTVRGM